MQTNSPYFVPIDQISRTPIIMSQSMLTRSLPSIVGSVAPSLDAVMVSGVYQSHGNTTPNVVAAQPGIPMPFLGKNRDVTISQNTEKITNGSENLFLSQKFPRDVITTPNPAFVASHTNNIPVISNSKVIDKHYKKKVKPRYKCMYHIRLLNIEEINCILTFEVVIGIIPTIFKCPLLKELNSTEISKEIGEYFPSLVDSHKWDILDSLVKTIQIIRKHLKEDIKSIPLNEDYVFHPCVPHFGLVTVSDYVAYVNASLDSEVVQLNAPHNHSIPSRPLSRPQSSENIQHLTNNFSTMKSEPFSYNFTDGDFINFNDNVAPSNDESRKNVQKPTLEMDLNPHQSMLFKCQCQLHDSAPKVPENLISTMKQVMDKLQNMHCKGVIILSQPCDVQNRRFRVLEVPADHLFVGLPCHDSSYSIIKGHKDEDFIIARDYADPDRSINKKCVFQKPSQSAVLLDSVGEIRIIDKPCLVIPPTINQETRRTEVRELPMELIYSKNHTLDCDQIVSVLESLTHSQCATDDSKNEVFDSPVLLDSVKDMFQKQHPEINEGIFRRGSDDHLITKSHPEINEVKSRRGSDDHFISKNQPEIQVERIFYQYVPLLKTEEKSPVTNIMEKDLPKQQIRTHTSSNEHADAMRSHAAPVMPHFFDADPHQPLISSQKSTLTNQVNLQNPPKPIVNQIPRFPTAPFKLSNPGISAPVAGNLFPNAAQHSNITPCQGASVPIPHGNGISPHPAITLNIPHNILPTPMVLHQKPIVPSQLIGAIPGLQAPLVPTPFTDHIVPQPHLIPTPFTDHVVPQPHLVDINEQTFPSPCRQNIPRQVPPSTSQHHDPNLMGSNIWAQNKNQLQPILVPHTPVSTPIVQSNSVPAAVQVTLKPQNLEPLATLQPFDTTQASASSSSEVDNKPKVEQTIGRFLIRPVTESTANS